MSDLVAFLRARLDEDERMGRLAEAVPPGKRRLAEVDAKRRIVELHTGSHECSETDDNCVWIDDGMTCETLRLLAQPYAGEPGWDEAWKVET